MLNTGPDLGAGTAGMCPGPPHFRGPHKCQIQVIFPELFTVHFHKFIFSLVFYMTSRIVKWLKRVHLLQSLFTSKFVLNHASYFHL